jgi:hypothetical protein
MSKYGNKFACWSCGTKFYDLNRPGPKCPKCGADPHQAPHAGAPAAASPAEYEGDFGELDEVEALDEVAEEDEEDDEAE